MKGIEAAYGFIGALLGGTLIGYGVDRWLHTSPWGMVVGAIVGFCGGLYSLWSALQRQNRP